MKRSEKNASDSSGKIWKEAEDGDLYFIVGTDGTKEHGAELSVDCAKRKVFRIRYASNGKVFTNSTDECENSILETGTRVQKDKE